MLTQVWMIPLVVIVVTQTAVLATSVYLHRTLAHRALTVHPIADVVFRTVLWLTTGQRRQEWVAVHRKHHAFTDREGDPHSPRLLGLWRVQLLNAYYYQREARDPATIKGSTSGTASHAPRTRPCGRARPGIPRRSCWSRWITPSASYSTRSTAWAFAITRS